MFLYLFSSTNSPTGVTVEELDITLDELGYIIEQQLLSILSVEDTEIPMPGVEWSKPSTQVQRLSIPGNKFICN